MTQHDALLAAVCAAPDDDLPRLVFADWCDENGEPERAEFVRVQIELAKGAKGERAATLRKREQELLAANRDDWTEDLLEFTDLFYDDPLRFRRGFVEDISLDEELLVQHGAELFRRAPIRTIRMGDQGGFSELHKCKHLLRITTLDLTGSVLDDEYRGSAVFFRSEYLANLTTLIAQGYDDNGHLDAEGLRAIAESKYLTSLRKLDISNNWLFARSSNEAAARAAVLALGNLPALVELEAEGIGLGEHAVDLAAQPWLSRLKVLNLNSNNISDRGARALAYSPHLEHIEQLDLRDSIVFDDDGETRLGPEVKSLLKQRFGKRVLLDL